MFLAEKPIKMTKKYLESWSLEKFATSTANSLCSTDPLNKLERDNVYHAILETYSHFLNLINLWELSRRKEGETYTLLDLKYFLKSKYDY